MVSGPWFCLWGSHDPQIEHAPGQRMVFSTSRDGRTWTPIERLFSNATHCENPVLYPEGKGHQWQPNLGVVDGELWVIWNHGGSVHDSKRPDGTRGKDLRGPYFSRLKRADGTAIPGFTAADCKVINADAIDYQVQWRGGADVGELAGRPVRVQLSMRNTRLYAIQFVRD